MNYKIGNNLLLLSLLVLLLSNCQRESDESTADQLVGRWDITEAYRSGSRTSSLDELFFEFFEDGKLRTNITGITSESVYILKGMQIQQRESELDIDYTIESITDSTLTLLTNLRSYDFRFLLEKNIPIE